MERKEHGRTIILRRSYKLSVCGEEYKKKDYFILKNSGLRLSEHKIRCKFENGDYFEKSVWNNCHPSHTHIYHISRCIELHDHPKEFPNLERKMVLLYHNDKWEIMRKTLS